MKILFLVQDVQLSENSRQGVGVLSWGHLELMLRAGHKVTVAMLFNPKAPMGFEAFIKEHPEEFTKLKNNIQEYRKIICNSTEESGHFLARLFMAIKDPMAFTNSLLSCANIKQINDIIIEKKIDLVWAEHAAPAALAVKAHAKPVIYSHHDWRWKILIKRGNRIKLRSFFRLVQTKRADESLIRMATGCVSASASEYQEIRRIKFKNVEYIPTLYKPAIVDNSKIPGELLILHLGSMHAVANRKGLERFLDIVWPRILKQMLKPPKLCIVGSMDKAPELLIEKLKQAGAECKGVVADLSQALRPYDMHMIPWEHNTGTRTRVPLAFNFAQVVISTKNASLCIKEAVDGYNCVLVRKLSDMAEKIIELSKDYEKRKRIGDAARGTFLKSFTFDAAQPRFNQLLENVINEKIR